MISIFMISCGIYSFSGASIPSNVKTISIDYIENKAPNSWSSLDRIINTELRQKMIRDAGLKLVETDADYKIKGYISSYNISAQAPTTGGFSNQYKLTISVQLQFENSQSEKKISWNENFSNFEVYLGDINGKEDALITTISQNISNQVFNKIFSTW